METESILFWGGYILFVLFGFFLYKKTTDIHSKKVIEFHNEVITFLRKLQVIEEELQFLKSDLEVSKLHISHFQTEQISDHEKILQLFLESERMEDLLSEMVKKPT